MALSRRSITTLLDLVEIKLSCIEVVDREDHREVKTLRACREELLQMLDREPGRLLASRTLGTAVQALQPATS